MTRPIIRIYTDGIPLDREMNDEEYAQHLKDLAQLEAEKNATVEAQAKREAALSKLAALGLTADDLKALGL